MSACHIEARDLTKIYNTDGLRQTLASTGSDPDYNHAAVDRVSLCIREGERVGIIGRNGAGKSTLLHMLAGLSEPTSGELEVRGRVTSIMTLGVGMREELSGRENIYMDGEIQGKSRAEMDQVIDEVIAFADLGEFIDLPVRTYSTGMKARLAFAMISYLDPEILIIDEALSAGDVKFSIKASAKIKEICARGRIVIIVSHSMGSVVEMCERCIWMDSGRIVMEGQPTQVTQAYVDAVRREDETQILDKFRRHVTNYSYLEGYKVERLFIAYQGSDVPTAMVEAGRDATIRAQVSIGDAVRTSRIHLRIIRLDGLVVADATLPADELPTEKLRGTLEVNVNMCPVVLGPATYGVTLTIFDGTNAAATGATILEVFSNAPPIGGRTALLFPAIVDAIRIP